MGLFSRIRNNKVVATEFKMIVDEGNGFMTYGRDVFKSDIVRSAIRPKARAIGKSKPLHIRDGKKGKEVNPDLHIKMFLQEPNPLMTWQQLTEKLITHLELNNNAFALIVRDEMGNPVQEYPIHALSVSVVQNKAGELFYKFVYRNGKEYTFRFEDVIHLKKDYNSNEYFGDNPHKTLLPLLEVVSTTDQGLISAIKNSNVIRWLLKFNSATRPEQIKQKTEDFVKSFLSSDSKITGAAGIDTSVDAVQVEPKNYIPNENQMEKTRERILSFFNTHSKIVQSSYSESEWIAYYEASCEPDVRQLSDEHTRKLFNRRQRAFGNAIYFDASDLSFASMQTKLNLVQLVDREIMSVEELREIFKLGPKDSAHTFVRRLDTARTEETKPSEEKGGD